MNRSVIVWGPPGCGKTTNKEKLKRHFGLGKVLDGADFISRLERHHLVDHLILCNDPADLPGAALSLASHRYEDVVFQSAMRVTKGGAA